MGMLLSPSLRCAGHGSCFYSHSSDKGALFVALWNS